MDAIVEEASMYEQSRSSVIQPLIASRDELAMSSKTIMRSQIFKYDDL